MVIRSSIWQLIGACACWLLLVPHAHAADVTGVWATSAAVCDKVFTRKGKAISYAKDADVYGSGFIIEKDRVRGRIATCQIKSRKEDGATVHLIASCATDVMLSSVQLSLKVIDQNKVARIFPGIPEMETIYERCVF